MRNMKKCSTCNKVVTDDKTEFHCPSCGKGIIVRCDHCKQTSKKYTCEECSFEGP
jgi:Zn-ribbon RNA-binding protein